MIALCSSVREGYLCITLLHTLALRAGAIAGISFKDNWDTAQNRIKETVRIREKFNEL